jgi:hypothetical protein
MTVTLLTSPPYFGLRSYRDTVECHRCYPIRWCPRCGAERPCAGPYCQSCGYDVEAAS